MSVTETTRYIYCHAIEWLRISLCYQIYIYISSASSTFFRQKYLARKKVFPRYFQKKLLESSKIYLAKLNKSKVIIVTKDENDTLFSKNQESSIPHFSKI